jgi:hypothetical protein
MNLICFNKFVHYLASTQWHWLFKSPSTLMPQMILPSKNRLRESGLALEKNIPISGKVPTLVQEAHSKTLAMPLECLAYIPSQKMSITQQQYPHSARMAEHSPSMTCSSKSSMNCGENCKIFWKQQKILWQHTRKAEALAWHVMLMRWMQSDSVCNSVLTVYHLCIIWAIWKQNCLFWG